MTVKPGQVACRLDAVDWVHDAMLTLHRSLRSGLTTNVHPLG